MDPLTVLRRLLRRSTRRPLAAGQPSSSDERERARKYWDAQVAADRDRRGVTDKHP